MGMQNDLSWYVAHPTHKIVPGCYTDDTQMSIAIAELLVEAQDWTPLNIANKFVEVFKRDEREGYARRFQHFLGQTENGEEFLANIHPESEKSGAAMRACPIGVLPDIQEVIEKTTIQAKLTHDTSLGINAAVAAALATHYALYNLGDIAQVGRFVKGYVAGDWHKDYQGKVKSKGWMSTQAALTAVRNYDNLARYSVGLRRFLQETWIP